MIPSREDIACVRLAIPITTVQHLIAEQFPQWTHLAIKAVEPGWMG